MNFSITFLVFQLTVILPARKANASHRTSVYATLGTAGKIVPRPVLLETGVLPARGNAIAKTVPIATRNLGTASALQVFFKLFFRYSKISSSLGLNAILFLKNEKD